MRFEMPPRFSLQPVLDYRHSRVEAEQIELARLNNEFQQGLAHLDFLEEESSNAYLRIGKLQAGKIDLDKLAQLRLRVRMLDVQIRDQYEMLVQLESRIDEQRERLVLAKQDEETLVILKEKKAELWNDEQRKKENSLRDDIYISQAFKRSMMSVGE